MKITTLAEAFAAYCRHVLIDASPATLNQFRVSLKHAQRALGKPVTLDDLTDDLVLAVIQGLRAKGRSPATANKCRSNLLAIWRWLCRKGHKAIWPDVAKLKEPRRIPVAWTREELGKLWQAISRQTGTIAGIPAASWWLALHSVCWDTGERIGAILALTWDDVSGDSLLFRAETRKGKTDDRAHRLHSSTAELLDRIRKPHRLPVFPWDRSRDLLWDRYAKILRTAGLPSDRRHKFHAMRRTVASFYEAAGGNATELLGHSTRDVTRTHYLDPRVVGNAANACDVLFRP